MKPSRIAAVFQAIVLWLWKLRRKNLTFRIYRRDLLEENRWRYLRVMAWTAK